MPHPFISFLVRDAQKFCNEYQKKGCTIVQRPFDVRCGKLAILIRYCNDVGRSYDDIERTVIGTIKLAPDAMSSAEVIELCRELVGLGFQHVIFHMPTTREIVTTLEVFGKEIIPTVAEIGKED